MKSILYVAIFVVCMFLLAGVLRSKSANNKLKDAFEEFIGFLKQNDFASLKEKYPVFINFRDSEKTTPQERVEDIRHQQKTTFEAASLQYNFANIADIKIDKISRQPFQYELRTDATITGQIIYNDASYKDFTAIMHQERVYSLSINGECVLNDKCPPK